MNQIFLIGRSGSKPELRYAPSGMAVLKPALCVSRREKNDQGQWVDAETFWVNVVLFGRQAEELASQINKGSKIFVEGRLSIRKYTGKDGAEKTTTDVVASHCFVIPVAKVSTERAEIRKQIADSLSGGFSEEDIPF